MRPQQPSKCFVVMPFGRKPFPDGSGRHYDFDKVYRVIMQRAIRQAGLEPKRADESRGSRIIHTDMFKDLRDHDVVLADLSLENPNVFYELGIRHVMAPQGTVLMCRANSPLPFDVHLSRVVFYRYDGENLDWEEAERTVRELQFALEEARRGQPDSPVHALLERVLREPESDPGRLQEGNGGSGERWLDRYQQIVADYWAGKGARPADLAADHTQSAFGVRALGHLCLKQPDLLDQYPAIAGQLYDFEQYDLVLRVYDQIAHRRPLKWNELIRYASAYSEVYPNKTGVEKSLDTLQKALQDAQSLPHEEPADERQMEAAVARCLHAISGMSLWKWQLTGDDADLAATLRSLSQAGEASDRSLARGSAAASGFAALAHLRLLLLLREQDHDLERPDTERHREAILKLRPEQAEKPVDASYLRWYQAITLADGGDAIGSHARALKALKEDARQAGQDGGSGIGRRQYTHLRRFIEQHSHVLRNPALVGRVAQLLQAGQER